MSTIHQHKIYDILDFPTFTDKFNVVLYEGGCSSESSCRHCIPCVRGYLKLSIAITSHHHYLIDLYIHHQTIIWIYRVVEQGRVNWKMTIKRRTVADQQER